MKAGKWLDDARKNGLLSTPTSVNAAAFSGTSSSMKLDSTALAAINEGEWQKLVVGFAESCGWRVAHCRKVLVKQGKTQHYETTMPKGWFDLVLVRASLLFVELKVLPNTPEPEQVEWADAMREAGQRVRLWYPSDWEEVQETLR